MAVDSIFRLVLNPSHNQLCTPATAPNDLTLKLSRLRYSKSTSLVVKVLLSFLSA